MHNYILSEIALHNNQNVQVRPIAIGVSSKKVKVDTKNIGILQVLRNILSPFSRFG